MRGRTSADDRTMQVGNMFQLATENVYMAMLRACGCADYEAYAVSRKGEFDSLSPKALRMRASRELADHEGIQQCTDWLKTSRVKGDTSVLDGVKADGKQAKGKKQKVGVYSKSDALATVNELIVKGGLTDKEKLAAIDLLNKLQQWNKEETKEDEQLIHFFLPLTCKRCNLYEAEMQRRKLNGTI